MAYDSTKTLEEQFKGEDNQLQFIGLQLFLPPIVNPEEGPIVFSKRASGIEKGNKYYTVTGFLKAESNQEGDDLLIPNIIWTLKHKNLMNQCGYRYKDLTASPYEELKIFTVLVLLDNNQKDSVNNEPLFWIVCENMQNPPGASNFNSFIPVPYLVKQKQLFQNQDVILLKDKSKWLCKEVAVLRGRNKDNRDSSYEVYCILTNDKGEQLKLRPPSEKYGRTLITEKEYIRLDHANRNQKMQLAASENAKLAEQKDACINKFGQHFGELVAQGNIETGMSAEMCLMAWGAPWDNDKTINQGIHYEHWFYNWNYNLYFENGILMFIVLK